MNKIEELARDIGQLTSDKNEAYGDSFAKCGDVLAIMYPDGVHHSQYRDMLGMVRVIDKLFRIATRKNAFGESPWRDVSGYGLLGATCDASEAAAAEPAKVPGKVPRSR